MSLIPTGDRATTVTCLVFVLLALAIPVAKQQPPTFRAGDVLVWQRPPELTGSGRRLSAPGRSRQPANPR
jgi:hypothetical protein